MDRGVRAIVSHRLPNAEELNAGCGDWLECCQAYIHAEGCAEATNPTNEHREQAREIVVKAFDSVHRCPNAKAICEQLQADIASALSSRDAEIREVLKNLRTKTTPENCWCSDIYPHSAGRGSHAKWCLAARALYAKLQPDQINGASSTPKG